MWIIYQWYLLGFLSFSSQIKGTTQTNRFSRQDKTRIDVVDTINNVTILGKETATEKPTVDKFASLSIIV